MDINHWYSDDVLASTTGDLSLVDSVVATQQKIVRRVLTNPATQDGPADYICHPEYGCGAAKYVGETTNKLDELKRNILSQIMLEPNVSVNPPPTVSLSSENGFLYIRITFIDKPTGTHQILEFNTEGLVK